jgi:hypothetical protein
VLVQKERVYKTPPPTTETETIEPNTPARVSYKIEQPHKNLEITPNPKTNVPSYILYTGAGVVAFSGVPFITAGIKTKNLWLTGIGVGVEAIATGIWLAIYHQPYPDIFNLRSSIISPEKHKTTWYWAAGIVVTCVVAQGGYMIYRVCCS